MDFQLDRTVEILEQTPGTLRAMLSGLSEPWIESDEGPDTWNAYIIVGHLIHGEKTDWIARLKIILEDGESRTFTPFDRFAQFEESAGQTLADLLDTFEALREDNLVILRDLDLQPQQLELRGTHPELGMVTASELLATWAVHDLGHIGQIARAMAAAYSGQVGPWRRYLRILGT
jgi:uncharacterized protein YfbU (UPF0304 family)